MPTSLANILTSCGRRFAQAALLLLLIPELAIAAAPPLELKPSETLQLERLGRVSDDERSVLRIEWRSALSGVDEARRLEEITEKLRGMETSLATVDALVRNMPTEKPAAPPAAIAAADETGSGYDWRLMAANLVALALVTIWWYGRRTRRNANAPEQAMADVGAGHPRIPAAPEPEPKVRAAEPVAEPAAALPAALPIPDAAPATPAPLADMAATVVLAAPPLLESTAPGAGTETPAAQAEPAVPPPPPPSPIVDFVLEEADPGTIVEEMPFTPKQPAPAVAKTAQVRNVEPTLQLAEIMLSMGLEQGAAQALVEYTEANPRHAVYHMLKLLGIYRKRGLQEEFIATAEKLRKNFNIQAEDWGTNGRGEAPTLENFARIAEHIQSIWSRPEECLPYLRHLLEDNRDGARAGFPQSVAEEILLLVEILKGDDGTDQAVA